VRVFNDRGQVTVHARVGERVPPGVVSLPSGWWASLSPGGTSVNALTADGLSDWGGGGDFHDTLVEVAPFGID
jgi:anaerobic selenocysteine-containing dehydrogenase